MSVLLCIENFHRFRAPHLGKELEMSRSIRMELPSLAKEGWPRHQVNGPVPLKGADGVVRSTSDNRWLERTTPSAPAKEASPLFLNGRSHPSFAKEYPELSCWPAP